MPGCTTRAASDDPPRLHAAPSSWRYDRYAHARALPLTAFSGAHGTSRPAGRGDYRLAGAVLLDGHLRAQRQRPDLRTAAPVVATSDTVGQCAACPALSGLPFHALPVEQRLLCRMCEPWHGTVLCRGRLRLRPSTLPGSRPALCHHHLHYADTRDRHLHPNLCAL